jgi:very-short-patch-repair endonuclease
MGLRENAKSLRTHMTDAEAQLWYRLRAHRFMGLKFKRQKPIGRYIVDFVCLEQFLVIELDGGQHMEQAGWDRERDEYLCERGIGCCDSGVIRCWQKWMLCWSGFAWKSSPLPRPLSRERARGDDSR